MDAEHGRLEEARNQGVPWRKWRSRGSLVKRAESSLTRRSAPLASPGSMAP